MNAQPYGTYDNPYYANNVYGHAVELLIRRGSKRRPGEIHLDVSCGFGRMAETVQSALGCIYVGTDAADDGLASLSERGFETHKVWLNGKDATIQRLTNRRQ